MSQEDSHYEYASSEMVERNPFKVYCASCGAPAEFDIASQNYHCFYCGSDTDINESLAKIRQWNKRRQDAIRGDAPIGAVVNECPNCGAKVVIDAGEIGETCGFCSAKVVSRDFVTQDAFPEVIIPFFLTREEAIQQLLTWVEKNSKRQEANVVRSHINELAGYYLPYQLVKGPVYCRVNRDGTDREYSCDGFLDGIAVNASKQLDNQVLDGMEPFDWEGAKPFSFAYIAGHKAKLQDVTEAELQKRVLEEAVEDFMPKIERTMQTTGITIVPELGQTISVPALLPAYILNCGNIHATVNGQTGRVAVGSPNTVTRHYWAIEPTLTTLALMFTAWYLSHNHEMVIMALLLGGILSFAAFGQGRSGKVRRLIWAGKRQKALRDSGKLILNGSNEPPDKKISVPVFVENIDGIKTPVRIKFYPLRRVVGFLLSLAAFNVLPVAIAWIIAFPSIPDIIDKIDYTYYSIWLVLSAPLSLIFLLVLGRIRVYDYPILYRIFPDGSHKAIKRKTGLKSILGYVKMFLTHPLIWITLFGLLMLVMSILLMLEPAMRLPPGE